MPALCRDIQTQRMASITLPPFPKEPLLHAFVNVDPHPNGIGPKQILHVVRMMDLFTELVRLNVAAIVTIKLQWSKKSPVQKAVTSQGIFDVHHPHLLERGATFEVAGFVQGDPLVSHPIFLLTRESTEQRLRFTRASVRCNDFRLAYAIDPKTIQHVDVEMSDRRASFVVGTANTESIEEWSQKKGVPRIFHIHARERVLRIKKDFNPPSPKMFGGSIVDQLNSLTLLHREGHLTKKEFTKAKAMLLL